MATQFSSAVTVGLLARRTVPSVVLTKVLADMDKEPCTKEIASGTFGTTKRACQVLSMPGPPVRLANGKLVDGPRIACQDCFVYKRARVAGRLPPSEAALQQQITAALSKAGAHGYAHIPHFIRSLPDPSPELKHDVLLFMKDVPPLVFPGGKLLPDLFDMATSHMAYNLRDNAWPMFWLQILGTLADLRDAVPGFQHNDLHAGNVLVSRSSLHKCIFRRVDGTRLEVDNAHGVATIIDFGLATTNTRAHLAAYTQVFANCVLIDFHHVVAGIYKYWMSESMLAGNRTLEQHKAWLPPWFYEWAQFLHRWMGQNAFRWDLWDKHMFPKHPTVIARLKERSSMLTHGLRDVLSDPYFDRFVKSKGTTPKWVPPALFAPEPPALVTSPLRPRRERRAPIPRGSKDSATTASKGGSHSPAAMRPPARIQRVPLRMTLRSTSKSKSPTVAVPSRASKRKVLAQHSPGSPQRKVKKRR